MTFKYWTGTEWVEVSGSSTGGTTDYTKLSNRPQINGNTLTGNKTSANLGLASATHSHTVSDISDLNDSYYTKTETDEAIQNAIDGIEEALSEV